MIYIFFIGFAIAVASTLSAVLGNLFLIFTASVVIAWTVTTLITMSVTSGAVTLNEAAKSSMLAFLAVALTTVFAFQVLFKQSPFLLLALPVMAFIASAFAIRFVLGSSMSIASIIAAANALVAFVLLKLAPFALLSGFIFQSKGG